MTDARSATTDANRVPSRRGHRWRGLAAIAAVGLAICWIGVGGLATAAVPSESSALLASGTAVATSAADTQEVEAPQPRPGIFYGVPAVDLPSPPSSVQPWTWSTWDGEEISGRVAIPDAGIGVRVAPTSGFTFPAGATTEWWFEQNGDYPVVSVDFDLTATCSGDGRVTISGAVRTTNVQPGTQAAIQLWTTISGPTETSWPAYLGYLSEDGTGNYAVTTTSPQALSAGEHVISWTIQYGQGTGEGPSITPSDSTSITCAQPQPEPTVPVVPEQPTPSEPGDAVAIETSTSTVAPGGSVTVTASGFESGEAIEIWIHSTPQKLYNGAASSTGSVSQSVTIPATISAGDHRIEVRGAATGSVFTPITVGHLSETTPASELAATGPADGLLWTVGAGAALLISAGIALQLRRTRGHTA